MKINKLLSVYIGIVITASASYAQSDLVNFTGLGRVYVTNDKLTGDATVGDTSSKKRSTNGYTLFDLGVNVNPSENLRASVILRARNNFGGFYGDGSSLQIRQFRVEGTMSRFVKYQLGDIDLGLTPYTLYNFEEVYHDYEADMFKIRRDIIAYENFNFGNKWRLQGGEATSTIRFAKFISKIKITAFANRIKKANFATLQPDRLLYGGRLQVIQSKYIEVAGNLTGISDVEGTVRDSVYKYSNLVYTGEVKLSYEDLDKFEFNLMGEFGKSNYTFEKKAAKGYESSDGFMDAGLRAAYKPGNYTVALEGSYREVGYDFNSPGAQTRRINDFGTPGVFDVYKKTSPSDIGVARTQTLFDRYTNEQLYNQSIQPVLLPYLPEYNNITPYGQATPNRKGLTLKLSLKNKEKVLQGDFVYDNLTEVTGEGVKELRNYMGMKGGLVFNVNKLLKFKKLISLSGGVRNEKTTRDGSLTIDLNSTIMDLGLTVEVLKNFDLMGGFKSMNAKGNELIAYRNMQSAQIEGYYNYLVEATETIMGGGVRYRFNNKTFFTVNYQKLAYENKKIAGMNYNIDQLFLNFTLVF
jgi:hypothetical protein